MQIIVPWTACIILKLLLFQTFLSHIKPPLMQFAILSFPKSQYGKMRRLLAVNTQNTTYKEICAVLDWISITTLSLFKHAPSHSVNWPLMEHLLQMSRWQATASINKLTAIKWSHQVTLKPVVTFQFLVLPMLTQWTSHFCKVMIDSILLELFSYIWIFVFHVSCICTFSSAFVSVLHKLAVFITRLWNIWFASVVFLSHFSSWHPWHFLLSLLC